VMSIVDLQRKSHPLWVAFLMATSMGTYKKIIN